PVSSNSATHASYFLKHGGGWSTLPGALDIEYNPSGFECYGLSASSMVSWIKKSVQVIYTTTDCWKSCTGNSASFVSTNHLRTTHPGSSIGTLPVKCFPIMPFS
ncbi:hypothetical protein F4604DRAFT_1565956, partial [Suillus subluteus]